MPAGTAQARRDLETRLIEKAWKDPEFKAEVLRNPKGMFEKHLGQKLPEQLRIFVHEEDANTLHFSIPPAPANASELSDEDLEKVAGGTEVVLAATLAVASIVASVAGAGAAVGGAVVGVSKGW